MSEKSPDFLLCAPHQGHDRDIIPGSRVLNCEHCGTPVNVAPTGQELRQEKDLVIVCIVCGLKAMRDDPNPEIVGLSDAQREELRQHWRSSGNPDRKEAHEDSPD